MMTQRGIEVKLCSFFNFGISISKSPPLKTQTAGTLRTMTAIQKIQYSTFSTQRILRTSFPFLNLSKLLGEIFFLWVSLEMMVIEDPCGLLWCKHRVFVWIFTDVSTHCTARWKHCFKEINIVTTACICYMKFTPIN
jgi:hypothetical protein